MISRIADLLKGPTPRCSGDRSCLKRQRGLTLIELIVATAILLVLSSLALPLARVQLRRNQEYELRLALREVRTAIDHYKDASDQGRIQVEVETEGYPKDLQTMVDGVPLLNSPDEKKLRVLRRIPRDPLTNSTNWGLRSYQDDADATTWGGQDVFDIYSQSPATALDGSAYKDW
jgi:general secretion pathway protein G